MTLAATFVAFATFALASASPSAAFAALFSTFAVAPAEPGTFLV